MGGIEIGCGQAHHAVRADLAGVGVDEIVELAVNGVATENKMEQWIRALDQFQPWIVLDPAQVERTGFRTAKLEPVEHALAGFHPIKPGLDRGQARLAELGQRRAEIGRGEHDQMTHRAFRGSLGLHIGAIEPVAYNRSARRMGDAGKASIGAGVLEHGSERRIECARDIRDTHLVAKTNVLAEVVGPGIPQYRTQCGIEGARDVGDAHFIAEAHVLTEVNVLHIEPGATRLCRLGDQPRRQLAVDIGIGNAPAVHKDDKQCRHGRTPCLAASLRITWLPESSGSVCIGTP